MSSLMHFLWNFGNIIKALCLLLCYKVFNVFLNMHPHYTYATQKNIQQRRIESDIRFQEFATPRDWWIDLDPSSNLDLVDLNVLYWINYIKSASWAFAEVCALLSVTLIPLSSFICPPISVSECICLAKKRCGLHNSTSSSHYSYVSGWFSYIVVTTALWMHDWAGSSQ